MKHKALFIVSMIFIIGINFFRTNYKSNISNLGLDNIEALASNESGSDLWFSNLEDVKCPIEKINWGGVIIIGDIIIPHGGSYTVYGKKKRCERAFTTNSCYLSQETPCKE